jgi:outer membrane lipoprotein SlyB
MQLVMGMKTTKRNAKGQANNRRVTREAEGGASVGLVGAMVGAAAGPPGMIAGAILGSVVGALAGAVVDDDASRQALQTRKLDAEIGVSGGDLGAPNLAHPRATIGAYSSASAGVSSASSGEPAEGPMQTPEG